MIPGTIYRKPDGRVYRVTAVGLVDGVRSVSFTRECPRHPQPEPARLPVDVFGRAVANAERVSSDCADPGVAL